MTEISLEFLAANNARILDEVQKMRGEMQTVRRDMQFISGDYRLIRHDLTGASLRFDAIEGKLSAVASDLTALTDSVVAQGVKLQVAVDQIDIVAQNLVQVLALLRQPPEIK
jgi:uncharacterized protein (DUF3084 family)